MRRTIGRPSALPSSYVGQLILHGLPRSLGQKAGPRLTMGLGVLVNPLKLIFGQGHIHTNRSLGRSLDRDQDCYAVAVLKPLPFDHVVSPFVVLGGPMA